jgi:Tfp pilus assembly protein PilF
MVYINGHAAQIAVDSPDMLALQQRITQAAEQFHAGDIKSAYGAAKAIVEAHENYAPAYALLSAITEAVGSAESAYKFAELAHKFDPANSAYVFRLGQFFAKKLV